MKAVQIHKYGGPAVLKYEEVPRPHPKDSELLIRVHATSVNPADWQIRSGRRWKLNKPFSLTLGLDVSGVVEATGPGVDSFRAGDHVFGVMNIRNGGAYAEYAAAPAANLAHKPHSLDHVHAAALPVVALTAWQALFDAAKLAPGQKVLIHAAAGGVGHIAVQLAKWKRAYVIATASGRNQQFLRTLGADEVLDHTTTRFENVVGDVDVVLEAVNRDIKLERRRGETLERSCGILRRGGVLVSICDTNVSTIAADHGVVGKYVLMQANATQLTEIARLVDAGYVRPFTETVLPLTEVRKAHSLSQKGHTRGKIILQVIQSDY